MNSEIFAADVMGTIVTLIILYAICFESKHRSKKRNAFIGLCGTAVITLIADGATWILTYMGCPETEYVFTVVSFLTPFVFLGFFCNYLRLYIFEKGRLPKIYVNIFFGYLAIVIIVFTVMCFNKQLFSIVDGSYQVEKYYAVYMISYVIALVYVMAIVYYCSKVLSLHDVIAEFVILFIPVVCIIIQLHNNEIECAVPAMAIEILIIYIMLQTEHEGVLRQRGDAEFIRAHHDEMTGLCNRLAYVEVCDSVKPDDVLGVVFCDINGLKYTNDHYGHVEGDKLVCGFSQILLSCFNEQEVFRISGDEFVVLIPNIDIMDFEKKFNLLSEKLSKQKVTMAAIGKDFGSGSEILRLIDFAERNMYEDKKKFYEKFPMYGRT